MKSVTWMRWIIAGCLMLSITTLTGVAPFGKKKDDRKVAASKHDDEDDEDTPEDLSGAKDNTPLIGDYANFAGLDPVVLEGVGLVVGLNATGGDPAPSEFRTRLLEDMKKRNVPNPNQILASPNTALVVVKAFLPPMIRKGETIDVEVRLPESAQATSLASGWLLECNLSEHAFVPGRGILDGDVFAKAKGPIVVSTVLGGSKADEITQVKRGRILGGATVNRERELSIFLKNDFRDVRNVKRVAEAIGNRFHSYDKYGLKEPMAEGKSDQKIVLKIHPSYQDNYPRYIQVVRHIAFRETPVGRRVRMQRLMKEITEPEKAERASLQLEAIGKDGIPVLKSALKAPLRECRFYAALALAYLEDPSGIEELAICAKEEPAFRVFALAGLATIDDADAYVKLRELMSDPAPETRYGAFRSLWTAQKSDPFIRGIPMNKDQYEMHVLETTGIPMVHVTLHTRPEVVVFGANQEFRSPMYLNAGRAIMVTAAPGSQKVSLARFQVGEEDQRKEVSLNVAEVINAAAELGADYPDILQMLTEANKQSNLPGELCMDSLPHAGRYYIRPNTDSGPGGKKSQVGRDNLAPNLFPTPHEKDMSVSDPEKRDAATDSLTSLPGDREKSDNKGDESSQEDHTTKKDPKAGKEAKLEPVKSPRSPTGRKPDSDVPAQEERSESASSKDSKSGKTEDSVPEERRSKLIPIFHRKIH